MSARLGVRCGAFLATVSILAGACSSDGSGDSASTTGPTTSTTTTTVDDSTTDPPSSVATTAPTTTTTESTTTTVPWRGQEIDLFSQPGDVFGVVGVEHDDVLNVRAGPGVEHGIIAMLDPLGTATATGRTWELPDSFWYELDVDGELGWSNIRFLAYLGGVDDVTSQIVASRGEIPIAATMDELGLIVTEEFVSVEPRSRVALAVAPSVGDLGEVTYDVLGIGDDAVGGFRLHVFGQPIEEGGFGLASVERTVLCTRGLSGELCV